jgi:thymidylate kinase
VYKIIAQGIARGLDKAWLLKVFEFAPEPDLTILLDVPPRVALDRITSYREVSFYEAGLDVLKDADRDSSFLRFQDAVRRELLVLMRERRGIVIDGELPIAEQSRMILDRVEGALPSR